MSTDLPAMLARYAADPAAAEEITPVLYGAVYKKLRQIAGQILSKENHSTLRPTELVHEAFLKLSRGKSIRWNDRAHFFALSAKAMRHILVDRARQRVAQKHGGRWRRVTLDSSVPEVRNQGLEVLVIDRALERLALKSARMARIAEMRVFGGLALNEIAHVEGVSVRTTSTDWRVARLFLAQEVLGNTPEAPA